MSAITLSSFLRQQLREQKLSNTELAQRARISRQTWYNLLNADVKEAKLSTLMNVAKVLKLHPMALLDMYFNDRLPVDSKMSRLHDGN
ncbi:MAG: hypothetical protein BWK73_37140 [Thiothrix lacustris]|uniref:HTH cro/C1-type domain-containing protein n=1 Tax=Thiothrix lacustris TaxID=525917 RepID=A0A1Y1QFF5_9GAMM|nr:MAG: hypothetical protein BWK73_37140 [Thiothrix lacustris]